MKRGRPTYTNESGAIRDLVAMLYMLGVIDLYLWQHMGEWLDANAGQPFGMLNDYVVEKYKGELSIEGFKEWLES